MPKITDMDNQEELKEIIRIEDLPTEMILKVASFLSPEDKKSLRLASTQLKNAISTYNDFDRAKSISSPQELEDFTATFESLIEAQKTQEVIEKDDDLQECTDIRYLFKEIKLILNPVSINSIKEDYFKFSIKEDHFKFLSSAAQEVCVAIDLSGVKRFETLERLKLQQKVYQPFYFCAALLSLFKHWLTYCECSFALIEQVHA